MHPWKGSHYGFSKLFQFEADREFTHGSFRTRGPRHPVSSRGPEGAERH